MKLRSILNSRTLKRLLAASFLIAFGFSLATVAQQPERKGPDGDRGGREERMQRITQKLQLTEEQAAAFQPILEKQMKEMRSLRQQAHENGQANREKMIASRKKIIAKTRADLASVLTEEQLTRFDQAQERLRGQRERAREDRGGRAHGPSQDEHDESPQ